MCGSGSVWFLMMAGGGVTVKCECVAVYSATTEDIDRQCQ